jgi:hypothetical protein
MSVLSYLEYALSTLAVFRFLGAVLLHIHERYTSLISGERASTELRTDGMRSSDRAIKAERSALDPLDRCARVRPDF